MKRFLSVLVLLFIATTSAISAPVYGDIPASATIYYLPVEQKWSSVPCACAVRFTKYYTAGENKFSEYVNSEDGLYYDANSTQEFFFNGDLIGYNKNTMRFHRMYFVDGALKKEYLNEKELQAIFPDYELIRISQFKENTIKIKRPLFKKKTYLIFNDTNTMFYNYWLKGVDNSQEAFGCVFTPSFNGKIDLLPPEKSFTYTPYHIRLKYVL